MTERFEGKVKWWNDTKGYGFLERADGEGEIFVHRTALPRDVRELATGQEVSFLIVPGQKGPKAARVQVESQALRPEQV